MDVAQPPPRTRLGGAGQGVRKAGRLAAVAGIAALSLVAVAGFALAVYAALLFKDLPDASELAEYRPPTSTRVYAWDGTLIGEFGKERRIFVPYDQIPPELVKAFLAAEDHSFFQHGGLDFQGLVRALTRDVLSLAQGRKLQGGSTITQQVAKNVLLTNDQSLGRKLKEAILARRLEQTLSKERILELYLNEIWLGNHSYGVGMAAFNYFGKPLNELTVAQAAYLASLPKGPSNYDPVKRRPAAIARRNWVLGQMADDGWLSRAAAQRATQEDLVVQKEPERAHYKDADYFMEEVRQRAKGTLGETTEQGGLYIRTTLDSHLQTAARIALMKGLETYDHRHGWRGAWGHTDFQPGWQAQAAKSAASERRAWRAAAVDKVSPGGAHVILPDGTGAGGEIEAADYAWAKAGKGLKEGDLVFVEPKGGAKAYNLRQVPAVNGALVVVDPRSGAVKALVGGYSFSLSNFNRATQAMRQPGSSFKPFVYATALENGFTPASQILDAPISLTGANGQVYSPENYEHKSLGLQPMRQGLVHSLNQMTVRIAMQTGMSKISANAKRFGIVDKMEPVLAMALGAGETTPFRLTGAYSIFANGGRRIEPHLIEEALDRQGKLAWKADKRDCPRCDAPFTGEESPRLAPVGTQVLDPVTAYAITLMLQGVVQNGTGSAVSALGYPLAGKTGTTNDYRSAWFVGYSPNLVAGVFVGYDDNRSLGKGETGAQAAVPIFIDFMREALAGQPKTDFKAPREARLINVHGHVEAFHKGADAAVISAVTSSGGASTAGGGPHIGADGKPTKPIPYNQLPGGAPAALPPPPAPAAPKKVTPDLNGLY